MMIAGTAASPPPEGVAGREASLVSGVANRRAFLRSGAGVAAMTALVAASVAGSGSARADIGQPDRRLNLVNAHTWEHIDIVYYHGGRYDKDALGRIDAVMRDHRAEQACSMDRYLVNDLVRLAGMFDTDEPLHLLSGYRTPETNAMLRKRSMGVARYSLHMEGRAADIHLPGVSTRKLQEAALSMEAGGVGYYKRSGFVHIDTGRIRHWERV